MATDDSTSDVDLDRHHPRCPECGAKLRILVRGNGWWLVWCRVCAENIYTELPRCW